MTTTITNKQTFSVPNPRVLPPIQLNVLASDASAKKIKILTRRDCRKAALCLFEAFRLDALAKLLVSHFDTKEERKVAELTLYEAYLKQHVAKGLCLGVNELDEGFETVAIWSTPYSIEEGLDSFNNLMESGYGDVWKMYGETGREKVFYGMLPLLHDTCERILDTDLRFKDKNLYTLVYLGSCDRARGKGNARKIFDFMFTNFIDNSDNNIVYLESSSTDNIPIYERFGFKFYEDIMLGEKNLEEDVEGTDYAIMSVMIRGVRGKDWSKEEGKL